jgi:diguanylate cyclase (GGDEF)-like protein
MEARRGPLQWLVQWLAPIGLVAAVALWTILGGRQETWAAVPVLVPAFAGVVGCVLVALRERGVMRASWLLLALAASVWIAARVGAILSVADGNDPVYLRFSAGAYLALPPLVLAGLLLHLLTCPSTGRLRRVVDAATDSGFILALAWYFVLRPLLATTGWEGVGHRVAILYPLLDVGICFAAAVLWHLHRDGEGATAAAILALGLGLLGLADLTSFWVLARVISRGPLLAGVNDPIWGLGLTLLAAAALGRWRARKAAPVTETPAPSATGSLASQPHPSVGIAGPVEAIRLEHVLIPSLFSLATAVLLLWHSYDRANRLATDVCLVAFCLVSTMLLRQLLVLVENNQLAGELHEFNRGLEYKIQERTRQLDVLHEIARAANASLDVERVLEEIMRRTAGLLKADATAVWLVETTPEKQTTLMLSRHLGFQEGGREELLRCIDLRWVCGLQNALDEKRSVPVALVAPTVEERPSSEEPCEPLNEESLLARVMRPVKEEGVLAKALQPPADRRPRSRAPEMMCAALQWQGRTLGVLGAVRWRGRLGETERALLEAVALEVAVALQNARLYDSAVQAADRDFVTGLYNHRAMVHHLEREYRRARRTGQPLAVIAMDLDNFKLLNDTHGHLLGDQALKCVAEVLREMARATDIIGRHGGDEFLAVCPHTDVSGARKLAERIRERLMEAAPLSADGRRLPLVISCGVAVYPDMADSQHELLAVADMNLYEAKTAGEAIVGGEERSPDDPRAVGGFSALDALVTAVDKRDRYTRKHSEEVTDYSLVIAEELGLSEDTKRTLRLAGLLHDLGKIAIPDAILRKPGKLSDEEFEVMKQHPVFGWMIVSAIPSLSETLPAIRHHHERYDGRGYPDALVGEAIPLIGRLMAVADAYSAMTTDRPYRKGMTFAEASAELERGRGSYWDPALVDAFLRAMRRRAPEDEPVETQELALAGTGR